MASNYCCDECGRVEGDPDDPCPECGGETYWCDEPCDPSHNNECCADYWSRMRAQGYWQDGAGWTLSAYQQWAK